jgi:hypothetical protein
MFANRAVRSLDISHCDNLASSLDTLHARAITRLYIASSNLLPSTLASLFASLEGLVHLDASDNFIDTAVIFALSHLSLIYLDVSHGPEMSSDTIASLFLVLAKIPSLVTLHVSGHVYEEEEFTVFCLVALVKGGGDLESVWMDGNCGVDVGGLVERVGEGGRGRFVVVRECGNADSVGGKGQLTVFG